MKKIILLICLITLTINISAQKFMTKNGFISFYSHTPMEDIKAENNQVAAVLDAATGEMVFQVLIKSFRFDRALMEEHFNENYMESDKFPKAQFTGKIKDLSKIDLKKEGVYDAAVAGNMTIHGVTKPFETTGTIEVTSSGVNLNSKFNLSPEDYNITIPGVVREKINKNMEVTVTMKLTPVAGN